jgi:hypothetical protein
MRPTLRLVFTPEAIKRAAPGLMTVFATLEPIFAPTGRLRVRDSLVLFNKKVHT